MMMGSRDLASFQEYLSKAQRVVAVCGAGLSASSGLPTFRGAGGMWRNHDAQVLATPHAFNADPGLVWQFYSLRRHSALQAKPNPAHYALAELARKHPDFLMLTQNVDGLSPRAGHADEKVEYLHGHLFTVKCASKRCEYVREDFTDPIVPALAVPEEVAKKIFDKKAPNTEGGQPGSVKRVAAGLEGKKVEGGADEEWPDLTPDQLPQCPQCKNALLRPGVVWFGENLDENMLNWIDHWLTKPPVVDLCLVIGTSATVYPAASFSRQVKEMGGKVAIVDMDCTGRETHADWIFEGDAAKLIPEMLKPVIGEVEIPES